MSRTERYKRYSRPPHNALYVQDADAARWRLRVSATSPRLVAAPAPVMRRRCERFSADCVTFVATQSERSRQRGVHPASAIIGTRNAAYAKPFWFCPFIHASVCVQRGVMRRTKRYHLPVNTRARDVISSRNGTNMQSSGMRQQCHAEQERKSRTEQAEDRNQRL